MSDWVYISGEGGYNQDFNITDKQTNEPLDLNGATITMFIKSTDGGTDYPVGGTPMSVVDDPTDGNARLVVQNSFMPLESEIYYAQIQIQSTSLLKTYPLDLRVIKDLSS